MSSLRAALAIYHKPQLCKQRKIYLCQDVAWVRFWLWLNRPSFSPPTVALLIDRDLDMPKQILLSSFLPLSGMSISLELWIIVCNYLEIIISQYTWQTLWYDIQFPFEQWFLTRIGSNFSKFLPLYRALYGLLVIDIEQLPKLNHVWKI